MQHIALVLHIAPATAKPNENSGKAETSDRPTPMTCPSGRARHTVLDHGKSPARCSTGRRGASSTGPCTLKDADLFSLTCSVVFTTLSKNTQHLRCGLSPHVGFDVSQSYAPSLNYKASLAIHRPVEVKRARTGLSGGWRPSAAFPDAVPPDTT